MSSAAEQHVLAQIAAAPIRGAPFPHCVIDVAFPPDFYEDIIDAWPEDREFIPLTATGRVKGNYDHRNVVIFPEGLAQLSPPKRVFWSAVWEWLRGPAVIGAVLAKFKAELDESGTLPRGQPLSGDALLVSDRTHYALGPHTDSPRKVVTALFYLPEDATFSRFGTSFYEPLDPSFRCNSGRHYPHKAFRLVETVGFVPNRLVMFPKSDRCFHGVEPVDLAGIERRLLIYDVFRADQKPPTG